jgi:hypothetical protein
MLQSSADKLERSDNEEELGIDCKMTFVLILQQLDEEEMSWMYVSG